MCWTSYPAGEEKKFYDKKKSSRCGFSHGGAWHITRPMDDKLTKIIFSKTALTLFSPFLPKYRHWTLNTRLHFLLMEPFDGKWSLLCDEYIIMSLGLGDGLWAITNPATINGWSRQIPDQSRLGCYPPVSINPCQPGTRMMQILVFINTKSGQQQTANIIHQFKYWKVAVNLKLRIYSQF